MKKRTTAIFGVAALLVLAGFDLYLALDDTGGNTYSEVIREWSYSARWLPFVIAAAFGAFLTHWFAKSYDKDEDTDPGTPRAKAKFRARSWAERLLIALALLFTVALGMGLGFWW